ncbi:MAG: hypothetical protein JF592_18365, partial [Microbacterium sp.]|nr:hypothetical protein [Microbacterium sp.]
MTRRMLRARLPALITAAPGAILGGVIAVLIVALVAILSGALFLGTRPEPAAVPPATVAPSTAAPAPAETTVPGSVAALAASLPVIDEAAEIPDYRRESFGGRWEDIDGNG